MATAVHARPLELSTQPINARAVYTLPRLIALHLIPGAIFTAFVVVAATALDRWGVDPSFALFVGIGLVLAPLELGYLALYARRTAGSWSPMHAVEFRESVPRRRVLSMGAALIAWFMACLVVSLVVVDRWLADTVFAWLPQALLQFSTVDESGANPTGLVLVALLACALLFNGVVGPVTEELYFRGHLLPRMKQYGRITPVLHTVLFAVYHFFSPWRWPAIVIGFLPITWVAWRTRSVVVSIVAHVTINMVTVAFLFAAALAGT
jgi:uncharacterized protein